MRTELFNLGLATDLGEEKNSEFKPTVLHLKIELVLCPVKVSISFNELIY